MDAVGPRPDAREILSAARQCVWALTAPDRFLTSEASGTAKTVQGVRYQRARPWRQSCVRGLACCPLARETTSSLIDRIAAYYGTEAKALRSCRRRRGSRPRHESGGVRADGEVVLNTVGREVLARLCGAGQEVPRRALPT